MTARPRTPALERLAPAGLLLFVGLAAAFQMRVFLADGLPLVFDAHAQLARSAMAGEALASGALPTFSNRWYGGYALHAFYAPAFHWISGGLGLALGDTVLATKLVLWLGHVAVALSFFALFRRLLGSALLAVLGALVAIRSPQLTIVVGVIGNHPTLLLYVLIPLALRLVVPRPGTRPDPLGLFAGQALLVGAMGVAHFTNTLIVLPSVLSFQLAWLWLEGAPGAGPGRQSAALLGGVAAAGLLTAPVSVPLWQGIDGVALSLVQRLSAGPGFDPTGVAVLLGLDAYSFDRPFLRAQGVVLWALAAAGALLALGATGRRLRPAAIALLVALLSTTVLGDRAAIGVLFFLLPLALGALAEAGARLARAGLRPALWQGPLVVAALVLPADPALPRAPYAPEDALASYATLPETPTPSRTLDVTASQISFDGFYGWSSFSPFVSGRAIPFGAFPQGAPLASTVTLSLASEVVASLRAEPPALGEDALDILFLSHVGFLVERTGPAQVGRPVAVSEDQRVLPRLPAEGDAGERLGDEVFRLGRASPALFAPEIERVPSPIPGLEAHWRSDALGRSRDPSLDLLHRTGARRDGRELLPRLRAMEIDRNGATAARLFTLAPLPPPTGARSGAAAFEVLAHREGPRSAELELRASEPGYVRLSYAFHPDLDVRLDGKPVPAVADALGGAVVIAFPAGQHGLSLAPPSSRLRSALWAAAALLALGLAGLASVRRQP